MTRKQLVALIHSMYYLQVENFYSRSSDISGVDEDRLFFDCWKDGEAFPKEKVLMVKYDYRLIRLPKGVLARFIVRNYPFFLRRLEKEGEEYVDLDIIVGVQRCRAELTIMENKSSLNGNLLPGGKDINSPKQRLESAIAQLQVVGELGTGKVS